jgi:predicted lipoprotein with Yx(FWY)xxD motif
MSPSPHVPVRTLLATLIGGVLIVAGCTVGSPGGGSPSAGTIAPSATSTPAATSGGGGGYSGDAYATSKPTATAVTPPPGTIYQIAVAQSGSLGAYLTGKDGKTLYAYQPDTAAASQCNGACAQAWPPFEVDTNAQITAATGASGALLTIERADGTQQVTYAGHPLYYYSGDAAAGDTKGDGAANGSWHVAKP